MNWLRAGLTLTFLLALAAHAALTACEGHGKYTSEFLDEATGDMARLRSATQYDLAMQQFSSGDMERALGTIDNAIALRGDVGKAYLLRGRILLEMGRSETAVAAFARGLELDPSEPEFHYYRGIAFERVGRLEESLVEFEKASALHRTAAQYPLAASEILIELDRLADARDLLEGQTGDLESNPGLRQALGHIAMLEGAQDEAVRHFTEAAVLSPKDPVLREDLCHAQIAALRFAQAEATLRRLVEEPGYEERRDLRHLHVSCLIELERPVEARTTLYRLVRSEEGNQDVEAWIKLIDVALLLRDDGLLESVANRLMAIAPDRHEGYLARAIWQRRTGELDGARRSLDRAIDRAGGDETPRRLRAIIDRQRAASKS